MTSEPKSQAQSAHSALDRLFGPAEEINGHDRCSTYMYRWLLIGKDRPNEQRRKPRRFKAYLHKFVGDDWSLDLHDHPKRFVSIGLLGSYLEETPFGLRRYRAPWIRTFPAEHRHRLTTPWGTCWTLVIVFRAVREWGFWNDGRFIEWETYVSGAESGLADQRKSCP